MKGREVRKRTEQKIRDATVPPMDWLMDGCGWRNETQTELRSAVKQRHAVREKPTTSHINLIFIINSYETIYLIKTSEKLKFITKKFLKKRKIRIVVETRPATNDYLWSIFLFWLNSLFKSFKYQNTYLKKIFPCSISIT